MNKKILKRSFLPVLVFLFCLSIVISSYIAGPPAGSTNAPGENTCYGSPACHGGTPNTGPGFAELTVMGGVPSGNFYVPDSTYVMMPYQVDTAKIKGGFQVVARLSNGLNAGASTMSMPTNTQVFTSGGYEYVEQTATGAVKPIMSNMHNWMYDWKAPSIGSGTVTFYVAFIAGNGNNSPSGDNIYTDTLILHEGITGIKDITNAPDFSIEKIFPLPAKDFVNIDFALNKQLEIFISVIDINGKLVVKEMPIIISPSDNSYKLNLQEVSRGTYFVKIKHGNMQASLRKIIKF